MAGFTVASVLRGQHRPAHAFVVCDQAVLFDAGLLAVAGGLEGDDAAPETQLAGKRREAALTAPAAARWTGYPVPVPHRLLRCRPLWRR